MSELKTAVKSAYKPGNDNKNPTKTDGSTNMKLYKIIMLMIPDLLRPTILMTPNSNVFVSTLIIRRE